MSYKKPERNCANYTNSSHPGRQAKSSRPSRTSLRLDLMAEPCLMADKLEYDEIDLVSECSSPVAYVPGRYLQLCDINADTDVTIWPVSSGPKVSEVDTTTILSSPQYGTEEGGFSHTQSFRKSQRVSLKNPRLLIPITVCVMVALAALGGLAMFL